jgi:hypothetical protein
MSDLDQSKLEAEIANLRAQAAKTDAERSNLKKSWRDWVPETIKVVGALVLGAGGVTAAITGYQMSEVKKERMDFEIVKAKSELDDLNKQKVSTQEQLASIKLQFNVLQTDLEEARNAKSGSTEVLNRAILGAADIGKAIAQTSAQLQSVNPSVPPSHKLSDYLVGLQTLGLDDSVRQQLNQKLRDGGYSLSETSYAYHSRESWFAATSTVFYYTNSALPAANRLAELMKRLTGDDFVVQRGSGYGVDPTQRDVTLFVHYVKN